MMASPSQLESPLAYRWEPRSFAPVSASAVAAASTRPFHSSAIVAVVTKSKVELSLELELDGTSVQIGTRGRLETVASRATALDHVQRCRIVPRIRIRMYYSYYIIIIIVNTNFQIDR